MLTIGDRAQFVQPWHHGPIFYRTLTVLQAVCVGERCRYRGPVRDNVLAAYRDALAHARDEGSPVVCSACGRDPLVETWADARHRTGRACPACHEDETGIPESLYLTCVVCYDRAEVTYPDGHGDQVGYCGRCEP